MTWRDATERALYGQDGFYRRAGPAAHFRTSSHVSPLFAAAVVELARATGASTVVDIGCGRGELLVQLLRAAPDLELVGVEVVDRPADLPGPITWVPEVPRGIRGLVLANEWLDNVAVDVVVRCQDGDRLVLVDPGNGAETVGEVAAEADLDWLRVWWPGDLGRRAEVGRPRDDAWARVLASVDQGVAVAVDYAHRRENRPPGGSLAGYRDGRQVPPVPDGSCDITSWVAIDACAAAGERAGATATLLTSQQQALRALGLAADAPPADLARTRPDVYLRALARTGEIRELTDPSGLGGFVWLVQAVGVPLPQQLTRTAW